MNGEPIYVYVLEDTWPRRFARVGGPNVYSVFQAIADDDGTYRDDDGTYRLDLVCGGLIERTVKYFASYPEVRPLLIEQWELKQKTNSWTTSFRSKRPLSRAAAAAEFDHGFAHMPETVVLRSVLDERFGAAGRNEGATP